MADNNGVITRSPSENPTVTNMMLHVTNHSSFRDRFEKQNILDHQSSFLSTVHELSSVNPLCHEQLVLLLVTERVVENDLGQRSTATQVVNDLRHHSFQVPVALTKVETAEPRQTLAVVGVGLEDGPSTLTLSVNHTTHCLIGGMGKGRSGSEAAEI